MSGDDFEDHDRIRPVLTILVIALIALNGFVFWQQTNLSAQLRDMSNRLSASEGQVSALQRFLVLLLNQSVTATNQTSGQFTFSTAYATGGGPWSIVVSGFNGESQDETIAKVMVNGKAYSGLVSPDGVPFTVKTNSSFLISFIVPGGTGESYSAGQVIQVMLNSVSGNSFNRSLTLPSGLQAGEKVILNSYALNNTVAILTVSNQGPSLVSITQILFNQVPIAASNITGVLSNIAPGSGTTLTLTVNGQSGITYPITVVTAAGNDYPSTITIP